jgi:hypothetical protein
MRTLVCGRRAQSVVGAIATPVREWSVSETLEQGRARSSRSLRNAAAPRQRDSTARAFHSV